MIKRQDVFIGNLPILGGIVSRVAGPQAVGVAQLNFIMLLNHKFVLRCNHEIKIARRCGANTSV